MKILFCLEYLLNLRCCFELSNLQIVVSVLVWMMDITWNIYLIVYNVLVWVLAVRVTLFVMGLLREVFNCINLVIYLLCSWKVGEVTLVIISRLIYENHILILWLVKQYLIIVDESNRIFAFAIEIINYPRDLTISL